MVRTPFPAGAGIRWTRVFRIVAAMACFALVGPECRSQPAAGAPPAASAGILCWGGSPTTEGCNGASRHPFIGFWINNNQGSLSEWFAGGDVAAAFATDMSNLNTYYHNLPNCARNTTITSETPVGSAPVTQSGGPWRSVYANRTGFTSWTGLCYGEPPGPFAGVVSISGICGEGNSTGLRTGTDDACYCGIGMDWSESRQMCVYARDRWHATEPPDSCAVNPPKGNPIFPLAGSKREEVRLGFAIGNEDAAVVFDSVRMVPYATGSAAVNGSAAFAPSPPRALPNAWGSTLHKALVISGTSVQAYRGGGRWVSFTGGGSILAADASVNDSLLRNGTGWRYVDRTAGAHELYDATGRLVRLSRAGGGGLDYTYSTSSTPVAQASSPGLLIAITDDKTRRVAFAYDANDRIVEVTTPQGDSIGFSYAAAGNLERIRWPDGASRSFLYERVDLPWALTGVVDEEAKRHSVFTYDANGLAIGTTLRTGSGPGADTYSVDYAGMIPRWSVVETYEAPVLWRDHYLNASPSLTLNLPAGSASVMSGTSILGAPRLTAQTQPAGSGCAAGSSSQAYDAAGNLATVDDFNQNRTCIFHDSSNRETARVEGLAPSAACTPLAAAGAALPAGSRKTSTAWHPDWRWPAQVAEPGRRVTNVYNGQIDPFGGGTAACAPASAALPDGKPIAVLCKRVEQATTDLDGHLGLAAVPDPTVAPRVQVWTYNAVGQALTAKGPRTDVDDTTRYAYYADTTADHTLGDLQSVTPALLPPTLTTRYNRGGQALEQTDANGVQTVNVYDERQRLRSTTVGGQTTAYDYWATGLLKRVTQADASFVAYEYDDAHRLTKITDSMGNAVAYTLDNPGNRTVEEFKDPGGSVTRLINRSIDALGRVQQSTGRQ